MEIPLKKRLSLVSFFLLCAAPLFAEEALPLEEVVGKAALYLAARIPAKSTVVVFNVTAPHAALSSYVLDTLSRALVNGGSFTIVDRRNLALLQEEMKFQLSGEVSDETAQAIGRRLGAQSIVSGAVEPVGSGYRLHIRAIEVETARVQGMENYRLSRDALLGALTGERKSIAAAFKGRTLTLDEALGRVAAYLGKRAPANAKIVVLDISAPGEALAKYAVDILSARLVNDTAFTVVDRRNLDALRQEMAYQHSGEVSDESAQAIGRKLGAQSVVSGSLENVGGLYRLTVIALDVKTAMVQGMETFFVRPDAVLAGLADSPRARKAREVCRLYFGLRPGFSWRSYDFSGGPYAGADASPSLSLDLAAQFALRLGGFFLLQTELLFGADRVSAPLAAQGMDINGTLITYDTVHVFASRSVAVPLLAKLRFDLGGFVPYVEGGVFAALPLNGMVWTDEFLGESVTADFDITVGWTAGGGGGFRLGAGFFFIGARCMAEILPVKSAVLGAENVLYTRRAFAVGLGYELGVGRL